MTRTRFFHLLFATLFLASCSQSAPTPSNPGPTNEAPAVSLPSLTSEWTIQMRHSGGIMGLLRFVEISSDGSYSVTDERKDQTTSGKLEASELLELTELVDSSKYVAPIGPNGMVCADCFIFDLIIQASDSTFGAQLSDISLPDSGLTPLVSYLRNLIDRAL